MPSLSNVLPGTAETASISVRATQASVKPPCRALPELDLSGNRRFSVGDSTGDSTVWQLDSKGLSSRARAAMRGRPNDKYGKGRISDGQRHGPHSAAESLL